MPCSLNCAHKRTLHIFIDGHGFFWTLACALEKHYSPIIQHDKARDMRYAVMHQKLEISLCNFHGLSAYREHLQQDPVLKSFLEPLLTGFKALMRSCCPLVLDSLTAGYLGFISTINPKIDES